MNSARKHFEVDSKLSIDDLNNEFNPNPNLVPDDFSGSGWGNLNGYQVDDQTYRGMKVIKREYLWSGVYFPINVKQGEQYTVSLYAKVDTANEGSPCFYLAPTNKFKMTTSDTLGINITDKWQRFINTFTVLKSGVLNPRIELNKNGAGFLYISGYKIEKGSLATPLTKVGDS